MDDSNEVAVIGLGYVRLTTALCFASRGIRVVGVDIDVARVDAINNKHLPIHEPGLDEVLAEALENGFKATAEIPSSKIYFITVGTPGKKDGSADLSYAERVSEQIGYAIRESKASNHPLVVTKSTVPPGTTRNVVKPRVELQDGLKKTIEWFKHQ